MNTSLFFRSLAISVALSTMALADGDLGHWPASGDKLRGAEIMTTQVVAP